MRIRDSSRRVYPRVIYLLLRKLEITALGSQKSRRENRLLSRRTLLASLGGMGLASALPFPAASFLHAQTTTSVADNPSAMTREQVEELIRPHFVCNDPELWKLAVDTYQ